MKNTDVLEYKNSLGKIMYQPIDEEGNLPWGISVARKNWRTHNPYRYSWESIARSGKSYNGRSTPALFKTKRQAAKLAKKQNKALAKRRKDDRKMAERKFTITETSRLSRTATK